MERSKNIFDKIGSLIPGFSGYAEREGRRNCDKILREKIVEQLLYVEKILYERMNESLKRNHKDEIKDLEELRKQVDTLSSRVKFAPHGATGFFNDKQIKENELSKIYQIDFELAKATKNLLTNATDSSLADIKKIIKTIIENLRNRNEYINEFK